MKKFKIFFSTILFLSLLLTNASFALDLYDDFSGTYIDKTKWRQGEWVKEIDPGSQRLLIKQASPNPIVIDTYPYHDTNNLNFSDPNSVNSIQALSSSSQYTLTVNKSGTGTGTVTSSPAGINCGSTCTEDVKAGTKITLKAKADTNSTFTGWSGDNYSGTGKCVVVMNADAAVTAAFSAKPPAISVSPSSLNFGNVNLGITSEKTVTIQNKGYSDLVINSINIAGANASDFSQTNNCTTIPKGNSCTVTATFAPASVGKKSGMISISSNDPKKPTVNVKLSGNAKSSGCSYSISPSSQQFDASGGSGSVSVTVLTGCPWTATSNNQDWITITSGSSGSGNGTVTYTVAANPTFILATPRTGTMAIAGQIFTVTQSIVCPPLGTPSSPFPSNGATGVSTSPTLSWAATSNTNSYNVYFGTSSNPPLAGNTTSTSYPLSGLSSSTTYYWKVLATNSCRSTSGPVWAFTTAAACIYSISPTNQSFDSTGGNGSVGVTAPSGCNWTATSNNQDWITITSGSSGSGSGTVGYSVAANGGTANRTGTMTISGHTFTVTQATPTGGSVWNIETVLPVGSVGEYPSLAIDNNGNSHISYLDYSDGYVKYAYKSGTTWTIKNVEYVADSHGTIGNVGLSSIALDAENNPHICYLSALGWDPTYGTGSIDFKYARKVGASWTTTIIPLPTDPHGYGPYLPFAECSIAVDKTTGTAHVSLHMLGGWGYVLGYWNTSLASAIIVDNLDGNTGWHNAIALDGNGFPNISYEARGTVNLKYAHWNGSAFNLETVDSMPLVYWEDRLTSLAIDKDNNPHIAYPAAGGGYKYAYKKGPSWTIEAIPYNSGGYPSLSLSLDGTGMPHLALGQGRLKHAYWNGSAWSFDTIEENSNGLCAIAVDNSGKIHIVYNTDTGILKYASK